MNVVRSEKDVGDGVEFLRVTGGRKGVAIEYVEFEGTVSGRGSDDGGPHRSVTIYAKDSFEAQHPLAPSLFSINHTGEHSFSEMRNMKWVFTADRERQYAHTRLNELDGILLREAVKKDSSAYEVPSVFESMGRKEALEMVSSSAEKRIGKYVDVTGVETICIGGNNQRASVFLGSLVSSALEGLSVVA